MEPRNRMPDAELAEMVRNAAATREIAAAAKKARRRSSGGSGSDGSMVGGVRMGGQAVWRLEMSSCHRSFTQTGLLTANRAAVHHSQFWLQAPLSVHIIYHPILRRFLTLVAKQSLAHAIRPCQ